MASTVLPRVARRLGTQRWVMHASGTILASDRAVRRITRGRNGVLDIAGLPSLELTVIGRKTGVPRTTSLLYVPNGDSILLIGSNWGSPEHPSWSANLRAATVATVHVGGRRFPVTVTQITGVERKRAWDTAVEFWPGYEMEHDLSGGRTFRVFELHPVTPTPQRLAAIRAATSPRPRSPYTRPALAAAAVTVAALWWASRRE
ncbi:nitroreductase family deazaflavin-dependent oxidoreductase [Nocardia sp. NPDC056611]|uniref:nitroreductase family deazaflavin-dependent oxidoreductase n=1 Tax=Nocardia sp. NPDC056611 TaxID=3345877 RepID=UPI0036734EC5